MNPFIISVLIFVCLLLFLSRHALWGIIKSFFTGEKMSFIGKDNKGKCPHCGEELMFLEAAKGQDAFKCSKCGESGKWL